MWTLTPTPRRTPAADRDQGAVLVIVAVMMVALLGVGAMVIDLGALYVEKRQLQNGADAAALAIAQDCAGGDCGNEAATAQQYADLNANDGFSAVDLVCGKGPGLTPCVAPAPAGAANATGWVRVVTSTKTASGTEVDFVLAPVMDALTGATVDAGAVAAWGPLASGEVFPVTFSECEWQNLGGSVVTGTFPSFAGYVFLHGKGGDHDDDHCVLSRSGQDVPGGFGFLDTNSSCVAQVLATGNLQEKTGANINKCIDEITALLNTEVLVAIYDGYDKHSKQVHVAGFVGFKLLGYKFQGNKKSPANFSCPDSKNDVQCIYGEFTRFTASGGEFGGIDFGARVIKMVG